MHPMGLRQCRSSCRLLQNGKEKIKQNSCSVRSNAVWPFISMSSEFHPQTFIFLLVSISIVLNEAS